MLGDLTSLATFSVEILTLEADWMCVDHVSVTSVWNWASYLISLHSVFTSVKVTIVDYFLRFQ